MPAATTINDKIDTDTLANSKGNVRSTPGPVDVHLRSCLPDRPDTCPLCLSHACRLLPITLHPCSPCSSCMSHTKLGKSQSHCEWQIIRTGGPWGLTSCRLALLQKEVPAEELWNYRYEIGKELGAGVSAKVYVAKDIRTGNQVAIKCYEEWKGCDNQFQWVSSPSWSAAGSTLSTTRTTHPIQWQRQASASALHFRDALPAVCAGARLKT